MKAYRRVYEEISAAISGGSYPPGSRLPGERELAERFSVSRPTVREALIALEINNVVSMRHGSGAQVISLPCAQTIFDVGAFELAEARRSVEGEAAALAATAITDDELDRLEACLAQMNTRDEEAAETADREFHTIIVTATGNLPLVKVVTLLWEMRDRSPVVRRIAREAREQSNPARVAEHRHILDALRTRDPTLARDAMRAHLDSVLELLFDLTEHEALEKAMQQSRDRREKFARRAV